LICPLTGGGLTLQYSNYFKGDQTSFQTGVDKSAIVQALTFYSSPADCLAIYFAHNPAGI
jgi:hypothetical protein